jgi:hypothetical protein
MESAMESMTSKQAETVSMMESAMKSSIESTMESAMESMTSKQAETEAKMESAMESMTSKQAEIQSAMKSGMELIETKIMDHGGALDAIMDHLEGGGSGSSSGAGGAVGVLQGRITGFKSEIERLKQQKDAFKQREEFERAKDTAKTLEERQAFRAKLEGSVDRVRELESVHARAGAMADPAAAEEAQFQITEIVTQPAPWEDLAAGGRSTIAGHRRQHRGHGGHGVWQPHHLLPP